MDDRRLIAGVVRTIVDLLVRGEFGVVAAMTRGVRLSAGDLERAVSEYPARLVQPPPAAFEDLEINPVDGVPGRYWLVFDLHDEKGYNDLSLELFVRKTPSGAFAAEVSDLRVL